VKKGILILVLGVLAAVAAYGCIYFAGTSSARSLQRSEKPELAWLKREFNLSDAEFKRVSELHAAYLPQCRERCQQIDAQTVQLQKLLADATNATPEIDAALAESARLRTECQRMMLRHFFQVSQTMPPEQGRRYLSWVKEKAFLPDHGMNEHQ
jgi:endogenous inhibitor of DNA gyrase (YacG/DUF329 family)